MIGKVQTKRWITKSETKEDLDSEYRLSWVGSVVGFHQVQ